MQVNWFTIGQGWGRSRDRNQMLAEHFSLTHFLHEKNWMDLLKELASTLTRFLDRAT